MERHNHSVDIYEESERFTPLGSDATVVYGYKDLRIRNPYAFPVNFFVEVNNGEAAAFLRSTEFIQAKDIVFERRKGLHEETVLTKDNYADSSNVIARSVYKKAFNH